MIEQHKVTIYSTPTCPYCMMAKEYFKQNKVAFEDVDVSRNRERAMEMVEKSGQMGVPVIDIGGEILVGYQPGEFARLLNL